MGAKISESETKRACFLVDVDDLIACRDAHRGLNWTVESPDGRLSEADGICLVLRESQVYGDRTVDTGWPGVQI